jgi:uncharacterized protein YdaU (DUF1376 family)
MTTNNGPPIIDGNVPKMHVVRVHINDWASATRGFSLDEEGFYWRFTILLYDKMGDLADNDANNARSLSLDIRVYKKMKARMLALGKIYIADGRISNSRVEREINSYLREFKRRSEAARVREEKKRENEIPQDFRETSGELPVTSPAEVQKKSDELPSQLSSDLFEKDNDINDRNATTVPEHDQSPRGRARPKPKPKPLSEVSNPHSPLEGGDDNFPKIEPADKQAERRAKKAEQKNLLEHAFEAFWKAYPGEAPPVGRKTKKPLALEAFRQIITNTHRSHIRAKAEDIVRGAEIYASKNPDPKYIPMPTTWLNSAGWQDHLDQSASGFVEPTEPGPNGKRWGWWRNNAETLRNLPLERWQAAIETAKPNGTWPWWLLTGPPGHSECLMPMELQAPLIEIYKGEIHHA